MPLNKSKNEADKIESIKVKEDKGVCEREKKRVKVEENKKLWVFALNDMVYMTLLLINITLVFFIPKV